VEPTNEITAKPVTCGSVVQDNPITIFLRDVQRRADHFRIHKSHLKMNVINSVEEIAKVTAADLQNNSREIYPVRTAHMS